MIWSALLACLLAVLALAPPANASPPPARAQHVVVVGISGLRWTDVSAAATPALWRVASNGSPGNLVDYAILPLTCPEDAWLTMNAGRPGARTPRPPAVLPAVPAGRRGASVPGLPALTRFNQQFHNSPQWGLLASAAAGCSVAVGPGPRSRWPVAGR